MTYSDCTESKYKAVVEIQGITAKVIQDVQQIISKDRAQLQEVVRTLSDVQKVITKLPSVHQSFY